MAASIRLLLLLPLLCSAQHSSYTRELLSFLHRCPNAMCTLMTNLQPQTPSRGDSSLYYRFEAPPAGHRMQLNVTYYADHFLLRYPHLTGAMGHGRSGSDQELAEGSRDHVTVVARNSSGQWHRATVSTRRHLQSGFYRICVSSSSALVVEISCVQVRRDGFEMKRTLILLQPHSVTDERRFWELSRGELLNCPSLQNISDNEVRIPATGGTTTKPPLCEWLLKPRPGHVMWLAVTNKPVSGKESCWRKVQVRSAHWLGTNSSSRDVTRSESYCSRFAEFQVSAFDGPVYVQVDSTTASVELKGFEAKAFHVPKPKRQGCASAKIRSETDHVTHKVTRTLTVVSEAGCIQDVFVDSSPGDEEPVTLSLSCSNSSSTEFVQVFREASVTNVTCGATVSDGKKMKYRFVLQFPRSTSSSLEISIVKSFRQFKAYCAALSDNRLGCDGCPSANSGVLQLPMQHPAQFNIGIGCRFHLPAKEGKQLLLTIEENFTPTDIEKYCRADNASATVHSQLLLTEHFVPPYSDDAVQTRRLQLCSGGHAGNLMADKLFVTGDVSVSLLSLRYDPKTMGDVVNPAVIIHYSYEPACPTLRCRQKGVEVKCGQAMDSEQTEIFLSMPDVSLNMGLPDCQFSLLRDTGISNRIGDGITMLSMTIEFSQLNIDCRDTEQVRLQFVNDATKGADVSFGICGNGTKKLKFPITLVGQDMRIFTSRLTSPLSFNITFLKCSPGSKGCWNRNGASFAASVAQASNGPWLAAAVILSLTLIGCLLFANHRRLPCVRGRGARYSTRSVAEPIGDDNHDVQLLAGDPAK